MPPEAERPRTQLRASARFDGTAGWNSWRKTLLESLNRLVDAGHTVLLIEHHLDVIKTADHVIDLGPEGGHAGGEVVATGTPEAIARCKASHTGRFLKGHLTARAAH